MINIKKIQNIMRKDSGVNGDAQRIAQLIWMIFLKVFDDFEEEWSLTIKDYKSPIDKKFRWSSWAKNSEGITGDELLNFLNNELFVNLKEMSIEGNKKSLIVRSVFEDSYNFMKNGTLIRQVINEVENVNFNSSEDRHVFNDIYETILKSLQSAGNDGEYYTPRPLTEFIVDRVNPQLGEKVLDPACGTGGFLTCSIEHLKKQIHGSKDFKIFEKTVQGRELKPLPHALCVTNLLLHGVPEPNIKHCDSLSKSIADISQNDLVDVIVANPPFGGSTTDGIENNFGSFKTKETADLFMVLMMETLNEKGRCGVVLPDGFLFGNEDNGRIKADIKKELLNNFNLHTIIRLPKTVFSPYTDIETNILFFDRDFKGTKEIWYYQHKLPKDYKAYSKTRPLKFDEFKPIQEWWNNKKENKFAWKVSIDEIIKNKYSLDFKNPHIKESEKEYTKEELIENINVNLKSMTDLLLKIKKEF
jgi:type I restriction enzyme M protein